MSGGIVSARRNRLTPDHVDMLTFLAINLEQAETLSDVSHCAVQK